MEYIWIIQNSGSKMVDAFCFLVLNDINMTLLLLLNTIYVLANVVILSNTPFPPLTKRKNKTCCIYNPSDNSI